jgi:hypothetical protein
MLDLLILKGIPLALFASSQVVPCQMGQREPCLKRNAQQRAMLLFEDSCAKFVRDWLSDVLFGRPSDAGMKETNQANNLTLRRAKPHFIVA